LQHRESEEGKRLDGYEGAGWGTGVKKLDDNALAVYRQRIEELTAIVQRGNPDPMEIVEWLVRCVEEPVTREEGVRKLSEILYALKSQQEQENEAKSQAVDAQESSDQSEDDEEVSNEQSDNDDEAEVKRESLQLAAALTQDHKTRLANTLFGIAALSEGDMELASLVQELGDERLAPYLILQLGRVAGAAPGYANSLIQMIASVINDEDLKRLSNEYDNAALAARFDRIEVDESGRQDSSENQSENGLTIAAIKRSAMLKDFLKLAEYKTNR
jgi:hypothetical protein